MARLPAPVTEGINAIWPEDWAVREKNFYSILGQTIRKTSLAERKAEKGEGKEKPD